MTAFLYLFSLFVLVEPCPECETLRKGWNYQSQFQFDSAIFYYNKTIPLASENDNQVYVGYALINLGNVYMKLSDWDSAIHFNHRASQIFEKIQEKEQLFYSQLNIVQALNGKGLYRSALNKIEQYEQLLDVNSDPQKVYQLVNVRGRSWLELKEYDRSMLSYLEARKICKEHNLLQDYNSVSLDIGNVYLARNLLDSAYLSYRLALEHAIQSSDSAAMAMAYNNLGITAYKKKQDLQAQENLLKAITLKKATLPEFLANSYVYLAKVLLNSGELKRAKSYLDSALLSQDFDVRLQVHEGLVEYYQMIDDFEQAFETTQLLDSLKNEQFNNERLEASKLQASIDLNQVNSELDQQVVINENQKRINLILMVAGLIILIVAVVLLVLFRSNFKLRKYNELLLKEQNHRVKNNLQMISSLLTLQAHGTHSNDAQQVLNESQSRINSVALLHRMLYEGDNLELVKLKAYLNSLIEEITYASSRKSTIDLNIEEDLSLPIEKATSLGLIINELITNSIKHVSNSIELKIEIRLFLKDKALQFDFMDNGDSFDAALWEKSNSFGNQLIRLQSEQLRGKYEIAFRNGCYYSLTISA